MTDIQKINIVASFPNRFKEANLGIDISYLEFKLFEKGIFAKDMDDKWNVFVLNNTIYLARSWTNFCIYKIPLEFKDKHVFLRNFCVNRDKAQYTSVDLKYDTTLLKNLLEHFCK